MEKLVDILKTIIGILLIVSFVAAFSSCTIDSEPDTEMVIVEDSVEEVSEAEQISLEEKIKRESRELKADLDTLGKKVKEKGGNLSEDVQAELEELNRERKEILNDSFDENVEKRWEDFKVKAKRELDSLEREI